MWRLCWCLAALCLSVKVSSEGLDNLRPLLGVLHEPALENGPQSRGDLPLEEVLGEEDLKEGLAEGYRRAQELNSKENQQNVLLRTRLQQLEQSSIFLFSFRRAEPEAKRASHCMGRSLLEASKVFMERFNITAAEAATSLSRLNIEMNFEQCRKLTPEGCEMPSYPSCDKAYPYRSIDGTCNNLKFAKWGSAMTPFVRYLVPEYEDGVSAMRGTNRTGVHALPSPRAVSRMLQGAERRPHLKHVTLMTMQWGQFLDHEIAHTPEAAGLSDKGEPMPLTCCTEGVTYRDLDKPPEDCKPIDVTDDPLFRYANRTCMRFVRSLVASRGCVLGPREQLNQITSYIDGSAVYGSTIGVSRTLRTFEGGRLKSTNNGGMGKGHLLPESLCHHGEGYCYKAGDDRVNEQPGLTSMHTLWLRVHERLAKQLKAINPQWSDETIYQESRRIVGALIQQVTYKEFLPIILGDEQMYKHSLWPERIGEKDTYSPDEDASIANVFATAAYRFGHSLVSDYLHTTTEDVPLLGNFMNPTLLRERRTTPSALLEGLATSRAQALDSYLVPSLTNKLFAKPEALVGLDLMALNIQRGRDHGLPPYGRWRRACGLPPVTNFYELATVMAPEVAQAFKDVYHDVSEIDLFPAGLAEHPLPGGLLGPTFSCIIGQQFSSLKKGDRFWYENRRQPKPFTPEQLASIRRLSLASLMCEHTTLEYLQPNPFLTTNSTGNNLRRCASYPSLNVGLWKEVEVVTKPVNPVTHGACRGVGVWKTLPGIDEWCTLNCLQHSVSYCPPSHCACYY